MGTTRWIPILVVCAAAAGGCGHAVQTNVDHFVNLTDGAGYDRGLVVCLSGAGGMTGEVDRVRQGLVDGGLSCAIETFEWSSGWVLGDQTDLAANKEKARRLARRIEKYRQEYPKRPVHLIGVSAGTGLIVWALEDLGPDYRVDNVFLIASSLSSQYDLGAALKNVNGRLYSCYSTADSVLAVLVPVTGTVDRNGGDSGGLHGFRPPVNADDQTKALYEAKLLQVAWEPKDRAYGHDGDHLGGTQPAFVRECVASVVCPPSPQEEPSNDAAAALVVAAAGPNGNPAARQP